MAHMTRRAWMAAAAAGSAIAGLTGGLRTNYSEQPHARVWQHIPPRELIRQRHLPNLELITHEGAHVRFYDDLIKDKKIVLNFMFAQCEKACPLITANLVRVQRQLRDRVGHDIFMYSITLKPQEDTPAALAAFAQMHSVGPGWLFLTGKPQHVETLRHALGYVSLNPARDADKTTHIGVLRIANEPFLRWSACPGQAPAEWIATSILAEVDGPLKGGYFS